MCQVTYLQSCCCVPAAQMAAQELSCLPFLGPGRPRAAGPTVVERGAMSAPIIKPKFRRYGGQGLLGCATQASASFKKMTIPCGGGMGARGVRSEEARYCANSRINVSKF